MILDFLTKYANLLLAGITALYAFLTWRMLREMRLAREYQLDAIVTAAPVPMGPIYAQLRLHNAGPAPAIDVKVSIRLEPTLNTPKREWRHPVVGVGQVEHFLLPEPPDTSQITDLRTLAERHTALVVELSWKNVFGKASSNARSFGLRELQEGWYAAGHLVPEEDLPVLVEGLAKTLSKLENHVEKIAKAIK
ncbi:MAG: hypothetical protein WD906_07030 [Anaerolineales bacterium]